MVNPDITAPEQDFANAADAMAAAYDKQREAHANGSGLNKDALSEAAGIITALGGCQDVCNSHSGRLSYAAVGESPQKQGVEFNPFV